MTPAPVLAAVFLTVMGTALVCFWAAFFTRKRTPVHKKWGIAGTCVDLLGTVAVFLCARVLDWKVPPRDPGIAAVHRAVAWAATALVLLVAATGMARARIHTKLWAVFLPVYNATYLLAVLGYAPWF
jgi:hypothetical protein